MAKVYRTATDRKLQAMNRRLRQKASYYKARGVNLEPPITLPTGLTGSQKTAALRRGEEYMKQRFVAGADGAPIRREKAVYYQRIEKRLNRQNIAERQSLGDDPARDFNITRYGPEDDRPRRQSARMRKPGRLAPRYVRMEDVANEQSLDRLTRDIEKRLAPNYKREQDSRILETLDKMFAGTGEDEKYPDIVRSMTPAQRDYLFSFTSFMDSMGFIYVPEGEEDNDPVLDRTARSRAGQLIAEALKR